MARRASKHCERFDPAYVKQGQTDYRQTFCQGRDRPPFAVSSVLVVRLWFTDLRGHGGAAGIVPNGQYHIDRVAEAGQIHAHALRLELLCLKGENVVAERRNLNLQVQAVDDPLKRKIFRCDSAGMSLTESLRRRSQSAGSRFP